MLKKELLLEGLDCANCAAKIETEVNELTGIKASMNFMNKTLTLETESETEYLNVLEKVKSIVHKHEPDVEVKEKTVSKAAKKVLILENLGCANCAAKIETQTRGIHGVNNATVDFVSKKLTIDAADKKEFNRILGEVTAIVKKIEPDVKIIDADKNKGNKSTIMLNGLDCANCAAKIEAEVKNLEGVGFASVDFVSKKLTMEADDSVSTSELREKIEGIVKRIEPDVKVTFEADYSKAKIKENDEEDEDGDNRKKEIIKLVIGGALFADWIYRALVFLVVSCPCALVLSIPIGFIGGIGGASKRGILVKGGNYLEALNNVEAVVFDKTGTLTKGVFKVTATNPQNDYTDKELLEYAAYAESYSNHPIALSIISAYNTEIDKNRIENYQEVAGHGIKVNINGKEVLAGNTRLMSSENINYNDVDILGTVVHVAIDKKYAGSIVISDEVKEDSANAIKELKALGVRKTVMLTGDLKVVADKIGNKLGLDEVYSELLPADKVEKIEFLEAQKSHKGKIVFVGDGINDAPVLARADIGMAMGGLGSDAAIEAADVVIMTDEPSKIASAIKIAKRTRSIVIQNIVFALGVKAVFLVLGALGVASMWEAVFGDMGVAIIAVLNAMRAMNMKNI